MTTSSPLLITPNIHQFPNPNSRPLLLIIIHLNILSRRIHHTLMVMPPPAIRYPNITIPTPTRPRKLHLRLARISIVISPFDTCA